MSQSLPLYIAGMGLITALGDTVDKTVAAINANISAYALSESQLNSHGKAIKIAPIPEGVFSEMELDLEQLNPYNSAHEHSLKMSVLALQEACRGIDFKAPIPLILALAESSPSFSSLSFEQFMATLSQQKSLPIDVAQSRSYGTGRAGVIQSITLAQRYLFELGHDYVLIGSSDSYLNGLTLQHFDQQQRLSAEGSSDGFVPGEAAGFIVLTRQVHQAINHQHRVITINTPGEGQELGCINSNEPYRGDGLDQAVKQALSSSHALISKMYNSFNGEHYFAKECGVAMIRSNTHFTENMDIMHPADCYGDIGSATGAVLMILSAYQLLNSQDQCHLISTSSDSEWRSAVVLQANNK